MALIRKTDWYSCSVSVVILFSVILPSRRSFCRLVPLSSQLSGVKNRFPCRQLHAGDVCSCVEQFAVVYANGFQKHILGGLKG